MSNYSSPVDKLLTYGDPRGKTEWPNYLDLGLTNEHISDLIRMVDDPELNIVDAEEAPALWAPLHAWRALGQLQAQQAIEPLLQKLHAADIAGMEDDWALEELPDVFTLIGPSMLTPLIDFLGNATHGVWARLGAAQALKNIAEKYPETRDQIVKALMAELSKFNQNDEELNSFLVHHLVELNAVEAAETIKAAFYADKVDPTIRGDWYEIRDDLGLDPSVEIPGPDPAPIDELSRMPSFLMGGQPKKSGLNRKAKSKRKAEKKSRKQNRKKK